jgi:hypothetical protein
LIDLTLIIQDSIVTNRTLWLQSDIIQKFCDLMTCTLVATE